MNIDLEMLLVSYLTGVVILAMICEGSRRRSGLGTAFDVVISALIWPITVISMYTWSGNQQ